MNLATAAGAEGTRDTGPEQFQIIVDFRHRSDSRPGCFDGVRLFDSDGRRNSANVLHARLVHAIKELAHVRTEGFDIPALSFGINRFEGETRLAAAAGTGDDG